MSILRYAHSSSKSSQITRNKVNSRQIPVIKGANIEQYLLNGFHYFDFCDENITGRTRDKLKLGYIPKVLLRKTGGCIFAAFDDTGTYPEQSAYFLFRFKNDMNPLFLLTIINSALFQFYYSVKLVTNRDSTPQLKKVHLDSFPVHRIHITTPADERERLLAEAKTLAAEAVSTADFGPTLAFVSEQLAADPERSDVVHDLLAHLAEQMIHLNKQRQKLERALDPFKWLHRGAAFAPFTQVFAEEIKYGELVSEPDLGAVRHDVEELLDAVLEEYERRLGEMSAETLDGMGAPDEQIPEYFAVKEPVFPFNRFPGTDIVLGPEMRSTGEVMGIDADLGLAFAKAKLGALLALPSEGSIFISVKDADKRSVIQIARRLAGLGYNIVSTSGTQKLLARSGVKAKMVYKIADGARPNVLDIVKNREIDLIVNTPSGRGARTDEGQIRGAAAMRNIPCITTMSGADALAAALEAWRGERLDVKPIQSYIAELSATV